MRREGRGHKLGAEETGVNRIFKGGHSPTALASAPPSSLTAATAPPPPKQSPGLGLRLSEQRKVTNVRAKQAWTPDKQGGLSGDQEGTPYGPRKPLALGAQSRGSNMTMGGLFPSMLCLSGLNTTSGLLPPPLLLCSSNRAARRADPASRAALTSQTLPSAWPHAHHPRQDRAGLGGGCLCLKPGSRG